MPLESVPFRDRLQAVEDRIERAAARSGRKRSDIRLVAVSKKFSADRIREAYAAGMRDFGENYVQEFAGKKPELTRLEEARFHLIGHLQSNKARLACDLFDVIQTADSTKVLSRLNVCAGESGRQMEVLLEVKLSGEASKTGALPGEVPELVTAAKSCEHLRLTGLMTIPPWSEEAEDSRPFFRRLADLAREARVAELSMGMSGDFEVAIEEGATTIRVGTALFGPRPKPSKSIVMES